MSQLYFYDNESVFCTDIEGIYDEMSLNNVTSKTVFKAIKDDSKDYFWCKAIGEVGENGECGKSCVHYEPRNKKSGICTHKGTCYFHGDPVEVTLPLTYQTSGLTKSAQ